MHLEEIRSDSASYSFCKRGETANFFVHIVNLDTGSYLCMTPEKAILKYIPVCNEGITSLL